MTHSTGKRLAPFLAIPLLLASAIDPVTGQDPPASVQEPTEPPIAAPTEEALRAALDEKLNLRVEAHFDNIPLRDIVGNIAYQIKADLIFDMPSIEEEGLNIEAPITLHIQHTPVAARQVLHQVLDPHGLAIINDNGLLNVATKALAEEILYTEVYDLRDILTKVLAPDSFFRKRLEEAQKDEAAKLLAPTMEENALATIIHSIMQATTENWLYIHGAGGEIRFAEDQLIVSQNTECHRQIASILRQWRASLARRDSPPEQKINPAKSEAQPSMAPTMEALREILNEKLNRQIKVNFDEVPFHDALTHIANQIEVDLFVDKKSIELEESIGSLGSTLVRPITLHIEYAPVSARQVLCQILRSHGLALINEDGLLRVASQSRAENVVYAKVYDVRGFAAGDHDWFDSYQFHLHHSSGDPRNSRHDLMKRGNQMSSFAVLLLKTTPGPWFDLDGLGGSMAYLGDHLIITQNEENHQQIETLLQQLRENLAREDGMSQKKPSDARPAHEADRPRPAAWAAPPVDAPRAALDEKLDRQINVSIENISLRDFAEYIANTIDTNLIIDDQRIQDEGLSLDIPISLHLERTPVSAWRALRQGLQPHGLAPINADGVLTITSETTAEETLHTRLYDMQAILNHALAGGELRNYLKDNQHLAGAHPSRESELKTTALIAFAEVIRRTTSGPWLEYDGSGGEVSYMDDQLVVMQNDKCHREIASILRQWRENQLNRNTNPDPAATLPPSQEIPEQQK